MSAAFDRYWGELPAKFPDLQAQCELTELQLNQTREGIRTAKRLIRQLERQLANDKVLFKKLRQLMNRLQGLMEGENE